MKKLNTYTGVLVLLLLLLVLVSSAYAVSDAEKLNLENLDELRPLNKNTNIGMLLLRYLVSVIGVLLLTYIGVKFFVRKFEPSSLAGDWVQIIDQMPLGTNKGLYLVEIEGKGYILGVTDQQINVITTIDKEERLDELRGLTLNNLKGTKFKLNFFKPKNNLDFHNSLQHQIKHAQRLYQSREGENKYEK